MNPAVLLASRAAPRLVRPTPPPYQPRPPLPAPPPGSYDSTLPFEPPATPTRDFYRGNFCGVRVPGIPLLPEMSGYTVPGWSANADDGRGLNPPIMALDITRYWHLDRGVVRAILDAHATRGYTHLQCSVGHAIAQGLSLKDYLAYCSYAKAIVPYLDQWFLGGGPWLARDETSDYWRPLLQPWIAPLKAGHLADLACVGWQLDGYNTGDLRTISGYNEPYPAIQSIVDYFAEQFTAVGIPIGTHWINHAGGWWSESDPYYQNADGTPAPDARFRWWNRQVNKVRYFHHQGDTNMVIPEYQARLVDTLQPFGDGRMGAPNTFSLVIYEYTAQAQFDVDRDYYQTEDQGDQRGFYLACTVAASHVGGYGNGARRVDGTWL